MKLHDLTLRIVRLPLIRPYVLSYRTFTEFEPIIVEARDADGRIGWGQGNISPASPTDTHEVGWGGARDISRPVPAARRARAAGISAGSPPRPPSARIRCRRRR